MELKAHFTEIHKVIISHLDAAQTEITAVVDVFTNRDIFEVLCKKAGHGLTVSIVVLGDEINQQAGGLNFRKLSELGGKVVFLPPAVGDKRRRYQRFCTIDRSTVIIGSYSFASKAADNGENLTLIKDAEIFACKFLNTLEALLVSGGHKSSTTTNVDTNSARLRFEMIRNLILLGEQARIRPHLDKLRPDIKSLGVGPLVAALDSADYNSALIKIDEFLRRSTSLAITDDVDIVRLRFELSVLELRLQSLSDEKAELERRLTTFSRRHDDALGELIQSLLRARAELAAMVALKQVDSKERETLETEARAAEQAYRTYSRQHDELQNEAPVASLNEEDEQQLKSLYRKACALCHPDKFPDEQKAAAQAVFIELQAAYKHNDLVRVREIYSSLLAGSLTASRSTSLNEAVPLRAAIEDLENAIARLSAELKALHQSDSYRLVKAAGRTEAEWQNFFKQQIAVLERDLARVQTQILVVQKQEGKFEPAEGE